MLSHLILVAAMSQPGGAPTDSTIRSTPPEAAKSAAKPGRGRDPWVFRCIFEDRARMVILAPEKDLWVAFNPGTCSIQKVWRGPMHFRGKVWDFSQDNCTAGPDANILAEAPSTLQRLSDRPQPNGDSDWSIDRVAFDAEQMWIFTGDNASITSPTLYLSEWSRIYIAFDEVSRAGPFRVEVSDDGGATWTAQHFTSTMHGSSDTDWQWNFKQIAVDSPTLRFRIVQSRASDRKRLRNLRIFGDAPAWSSLQNKKSSQIVPRWRGYTYSDNQSEVALEYDLPLEDGSHVSVRQTVDLTTDANGVMHWSERYSITGLPKGVSLVHSTPWPVVRVSGPVTNLAANPELLAHALEFTENGDSTLMATINPEARR